MSAQVRHPDAIQPIGFLILLSRDWRISHASANIDQFFPMTEKTLIGQPITGLFTDDSVHDLRNRLAMVRGPDVAERIFGCTLAGDDRRFDVSLHMNERCVLIEAEPASAHDHGDIIGIVRGMIGGLDQGGDLPALLNAGARRVRALTGFDHVMIDRLASDGTSEVVAECARHGAKSCLGVQYPANPMSPEGECRDHPLLAIIADSQAKPIAIVPPGRDDHDPLEIGQSVLRSAPPDQLASLRDMGVRAAMSLSINIEGAYWGQILCHHRSPRCLDFGRRAVAELFAEMFALRIHIRELQSIIETERGG